MEYYKIVILIVYFSVNTYLATKYTHDDMEYPIFNAVSLYFLGLPILVVLLIYFGIIEPIANYTEVKFFLRWYFTDFYNKEWFVKTKERFKLLEADPNYSKTNWFRKRIMKMIRKKYDEYGDTI